MTEEAQSVSQEAPVTSEVQTSESTFAIPEEYASAGWAEGVKSSDDLWKMTANAQSLIGKRPAGIPDSNAAPEEWDKFYKAIGRPDDASGYELSAEFEGLPGGVDLSKSQAMAQELAHQIGLSPKQAQDLWQGYMSKEIEAYNTDIEAKQAREVELDAEFDKLSNSMFGDSFKDVSQQAEAYLKENLPSELDGVVDTMRDNPKSMLAMIHLVNKTQQDIIEVKKKYGAEDKLSSGGQVSAQSVHEITAKLVEAKSKYNSESVFSPQRQVIMDEINALRSQLSSAVKK